MTTNLKLKIYGLQRTGTNYAQKLLEANYHIDILVNKGGWKHGVYCLPSRLHKELDCLVITKHPLAWLDSWHRRKCNAKPFNRPEWIAENISRYNALYTNWLGITLQNHRLIISRYEDMLKSPQKECERIAEILNAEVSHGPFIDFPTVIKPEAKVGTKPFNKDYYLKYGFMGKYRRESLTIVKDHLDATLLEKLDYHIPPQY